MGTLKDRYGSDVKSSSGESVRTRYDDDEKPKSKTVDDVQDYASLGRRAAASSPFGGPKEFISEEKRAEKETEAEPSRKSSDGVFSNVDAAVKSATSRTSDASDTTSKPRAKAIDKAVAIAAPKRAAPEVKKAPEPTKLPGKPSEAKKEPKPLPGKPEAKTEPKPYSGVRTRAGTPVATSKGDTEEDKARGRKFMEENLRKQKQDFENTPLMRALTGGGRSEYYKKKAEAERAGYGMKKGGSVSSASKRGDGIAQRGKTKGRIY